MEFGRFLAAALPATGENVSIWPFVLLGVGILLICCPGGSADRQQEEGRTEERSLRAGSAVPSEPGTEVRKSPAEGSSFRGAFGMRYPKTALRGGWGGQNTPVAVPPPHTPPAGAAGDPQRQ